MTAIDVRDEAEDRFRALCKVPARLDEFGCRSSEDLREIAADGKLPAALVGAACAEKMARELEERSAHAPELIPMAEAHEANVAAAKRATGFDESEVADAEAMDRAEE